MVRTPAWKRYNWRVVWLSLALRCIPHRRCLRLQAPACDRPAQILRRDPCLPCPLSASLARLAATWSKSKTNMSACSWSARRSGRARSRSAWRRPGASSITSASSAMSTAYWIAILWFFGLGLGGIVQQADARREAAADGKPSSRPARRAQLEPAGPRRAARSLAPERQRHRDRQVRSLAAARLPHRRAVRRCRSRRCSSRPRAAARKRSDFPSNKGKLPCAFSH